MKKFFIKKMSIANLQLASLVIEINSVNCVVETAKSKNIGCCKPKDFDPAIS